ncbi:MAG: anaerobic ribonucleoside-triphosphate reductase activating protein [Eggerthellaceae bacterium]|nr:anaerobic ribonucleoside-triphosphate reductase activating protein [Eggerthellaceae bacterium]
MNYGNIKYFDIANGVGVRTTLFVSGCTHACPGCFQPETWDFSYGEEFTREVENQIIESLKPTYVAGLTVLGGEPMEPSNQEALAPFLKRVKEELPDKTIWLYTGDVWDDLVLGGDRCTIDTPDILSCVDVLVEGPFVEAEKDVGLKFRGSANQRIIDMPATLATGTVQLWADDPAFDRGIL